MSQRKCLIFLECCHCGRNFELRIFWELKEKKRAWVALQAAEHQMGQYS